MGSAMNAAIGILHPERAAVAVRVDGVRDVAPRRLRGDVLGELRAARIGVPQRHNVIAARGHALQPEGEAK